MLNRRILAFAATALLTAACSSSPKPGTSPAPSTTPSGGASAGAAGNTAGDTMVGTEVLVNVINNRVPPSMITVFVIGPSVGRILLGNVQINETKAFTFRAGNLNGDYRLIAQAPSGAELPSQKFNLTPTLRFVQWTLDVNSILQYQTPK